MVTRAAALRTYVAEHPGSSGRQIALALEIPLHTCTNHLANMARRGLLSASGERLERTYRLGREVIKEWSLDPAEARRRRTVRERGRRKLKAASSPKPLRAMLTDLVRRDPVSATPAQSVDEYLAQGGRIEVLPGYTYQPPPLMPCGVRW